MQLLLVRHAEPVRIGPEESGGQPVDPELTPLGTRASGPTRRLARRRTGAPRGEQLAPSARRDRDTHRGRPRARGRGAHRAA